MEVGKSHRRTTDSRVTPPVNTFLSENRWEVITNIGAQIGFQTLIMKARFFGVRWKTTGNEPLTSLKRFLCHNVFFPGPGSSERAYRADILRPNPDHWTASIDG